MHGSEDLPAAAQRERVKPRALAPGDLVAVVAPGSRPDPADLEIGVEHLRARGLRVRVGRHVMDRYGHMAGADRDRAADLMEAFLDDEVRGIVCARGGSGSSRIVPHLDFVAIASRPKVFVGYSDVTVLHLALARHAGWPTFYGPMAATELGSSCSGDACGLWALTGSREPVGVLGSARSAEVRAVVGGAVEGILAGGTLCVIESAIGTPYSLDARGRILALEDADEPAWRVDRMLTHLGHAGILDAAAGFVLGSLAHPALSDPDDLPESQSVSDHVASLRKPTLAGYPFGHIPQPVALPLSCRVRLDADARTLTLLEAAVE